MSDLKYECPHCQDCFDKDEWNHTRHYSAMTLPEFLNEDGLFDCPSCEQVVNSRDMNVY